MSARIEVFEGRTYRDYFKGSENDCPAGTPNGAWYWRLVGGNGETVCVSEAYTRKTSAKRGAARAQRLMFELAMQDYPQRYVIGMGSDFTSVAEFTP